MPIKSSNKSKSDIVELEEGNYDARVVGLVLTGEEQKYGEEDKTIHKMIVTFEIPSETVELDGEERPRHISAFLTASCHEKSVFTKIIKACGSQLGDDFVVEVDGDLQIEDLSPLAGAGLSISIEHNKNGRANVKGYAKLRSKALASLEELANNAYIMDPYLEEPMVVGDIDDVPAWILKRMPDALDVEDFTDSALDAIEARLEDIDNGDEEEEEKPAPKKKAAAKSKSKAKPKAKAKRKPEPEEEDEDDDDWDDDDED